MQRRKHGRIMALWVMMGMTMVIGQAMAGGNRQAASGGNVATLEVLHGVGWGQINYDRAGWYADWLRDNLGVALSFRQADAQVFMNMLASRQMADIYVDGVPARGRQAAEAGLLLNLDNYKDKLPALFNNPVYANAIKFGRANNSSDGNFYILPAEIGKSNYINFQPSIRYDLYERLGSPKLNTMDDLIPLLKRMMELEPVSETGHKTWGFSFFPEWDGDDMAYSHYFSALNGGSYGPLITMLETTGPGATGEIRSRLDDDSLTKKNLRWLFKANQAGILDPDSATQRYDTVHEKYADGSVFFSLGWERGYNTADRVGAANPKGYMQILTDDMLIPIQPDALVGTGWFMALGAGTKNLDAALAYLNHFSSVEGQELLFNLPEGVIWEKGSDGLGHIKESAWQYLDNDAGIPAIGGSKAGDAAGIMNFPTIMDAEISPITGQFMNRNYWPEVILHNSAANNLFKRWSAANNGAISYYDLITSTGHSVKVNFAGTLVPSPPQEIQTIVTQVGNILKTNFWRMVFAANEAEFEALWKDAQSKADTLGMQQIVNWGKTAWAKAQADAALYR
jgi:hypothetical protein